MNVRTYRMSIRTIACLMFVCAGFAQTAPNFSGAWRLDDSRSTNYGIAGQTRFDTIRQEGSRLKVRTFIALYLSPSWSEDWIIDGKPHAAMDRTNRPETVTAYWQGTDLVFRKENSAGDLIRETWSLSAGGQVLTMVIVGKDRGGVWGGVGDRKLVFTKARPETPKP